ncbi:MAG: universal stress protein [Thermodesulfovibrionales bacterium]
MGRYCRILVAFDGSDSSKNALRQAIKLARAEKTPVKALSVMPSYEGDLELVGVRKIKEAMRGQADAILADALEVAKAEGATISTGAESGVAYERIVDAAETESCDLIVMGRRGARRLERMLVGSVTARVIGHSRCDVLVVPRGASVGWDNITVAVDGSRYGDIALERAMDFAKSYGGKVAAVSVVEVNEEFYAQAPETVERMVGSAKALMDELKRKAHAQGIDMETHVREGEPHRWIIEIAKATQAGVIFMGSHGRTGLRRLLMGSVAEKVIGLSEVPVLVAKSGL